MTIAPSISSLSELKVEISSDAHDYLEKQLNYESESAPKLQKDCKNGENQLDSIIEAMKTSSQITLCRVNLILAEREEIIKKLYDILKPWHHERLNLMRELYYGCVALSSTDDMNNQNDNFELQITPHDIFEDCIEIQLVQRSQGSSEKKLKKATGLVISPHHHHPPLMTTQISTINQLGTSTSVNDSNSSLSITSNTITSNKIIERNRLSSMNMEKRARRIELGWPDTHRVIICDRFCGEAVLRGSEIFVRGIICADSGVRTGEEVAVYADLNKKGTSFSRGIFLEQYNGHCVFMGTGITGCSRADMFRNQKGIGVYMSKGVRVSDTDLPPLNGILEDKIMLQNLPSIVVGAALEPKQGEVILDMCCAPGGKTSHIASLVRNDALIVACDKSKRKILTMRDKLRARGASCIVPLAVDSTHLVVSDGSNWMSVKEVINNATSSKCNLLNIKAFYPESFDRILLDPPCSALGLRPKLCVHASVYELNEQYPSFQKMFIHKAITLLRPGGIMTYSTCTINASENEDMVRYILDEFPCMELVPIVYVTIGRSGLVGRGLSDKEREMVRRFHPTDDDDTMGFFVAKFVKRGSIQLRDGERGPNYNDV